MSKNVTLWGASYSDVPSIEVPSTGGGVAAFHDVSDTTAVASDVASGKLFHDANGALTAGTGSSTTVEPLSVTENGTYTAPTGTAYSPVTVNVSGGGGGGGSASDAVKFYDYDGTILHSYSADEFAALTAMPANPTHTGLISQGWNWSLADAQAYVAEYGACNIGQMYITDDGKTRIYIELSEKTLSPEFCIAVNGLITIDWGDGSSTDTLSGSSLSSLTYVANKHVYPSTGSYVITLTATSGTFAFYGDSNSWGVLRKNRGSDYTTYGDHNSSYVNSIKKIELGDGVSIGNYAFYHYRLLESVTMPYGLEGLGNYAFANCYALTSITIPNSVTSIGGNTFEFCYLIKSISIPHGLKYIGQRAFYSCSNLNSILYPNSVVIIGGSMNRSNISLESSVLPDTLSDITEYLFYNDFLLASVTIPNTVIRIGQYAFYTCYALTSITIPNSVTSIGKYAFYSCQVLTSITFLEGLKQIGDYAFSNCYALTSITIPNSVTSIGGNAFNSCYGLAEIHFKPTTPPTVASANAFSRLPTDCIIYVPTGTLEAYTTATNYPSSSKYTYVEESA